MRRALSLGLCGIGLFFVLGFPLSVWSATNGLVHDVASTPGVEVVDRDLRILSLVAGSDADPATIVVRPVLASGETPADAFRRVMTEAGFSPNQSYTPFNEVDTGYHARERIDSYDADLYRVLAEDLERGTVTIGLSFFDTDSLLFAPIGVFAGLCVLGLAWIARPGWPADVDADRTDDTLVDA